MTQGDEELLICRVKSLLDRYESAGQVSTREVDFLRACKKMIETRGRVTPNMERWQLWAFGLKPWLICPMPWPCHRKAGPLCRGWMFGW